MSRYILDGDDLCLVMQCAAECGWESWVGWLDADEDELDKRIREHLPECPGPKEQR
jgi:hypothetical protein